MNRKHIYLTLLFVLLVLASVYATGRGSAGSSDAGQTTGLHLTVAIDGSGDFTSLQAAIDAAPDSSALRTVIYIKNGAYNSEKLLIPATKLNLTLVGEDREQTVISYHMYDCSSPETANKCPEEAYLKYKDNAALMRTSATLTINASGCRLENLTLANTAGPVGQGLAVAVQADRTIFVGCRLLGYQDTVLLRTGGQRTYFEDCFIQGHTDFIYGSGIGYFYHCEVSSWGGGWVTAPATPRDQAYGFVFNECQFTYATDSPRKGDDGRLIAIGRPWHNYPKVAILHSDLCEMIDPIGWPSVWNMPYAPTSPDLHLYEYDNSGPGADMSQRAAWVGLRALTAEEATLYEREAVLGSFYTELLSMNY